MISNPFLFLFFSSRTKPPEVVSRITHQHRPEGSSEEDDEDGDQWIRLLNKSYGDAKRREPGKLFWKSRKVVRKTKNISVLNWKPPLINTCGGLNFMKFNFQKLFFLFSPNKNHCCGRRWVHFPVVENAMGVKRSYLDHWIRRKSKAEFPTIFGLTVDSQLERESAQKWTKNVFFERMFFTLLTVKWKFHKIVTTFHKMETHFIRESAIHFLSKDHCPRKLEMMFMFWRKCLVLPNFFLRVDLWNFKNIVFSKRTNMSKSNK